MTATQPTTVNAQKSIEWADLGDCEGVVFYVRFSLQISTLYCITNINPERVHVEQSVYVPGNLLQN